jgi:methanesulfonate monooxygenase large subunit
LLSDSPKEREQRINDHNTIWGPFGRNLHEDLLGVTGQGVAMAPGTERRNILHGRHENNTIHDEIGMRHFYAEWGKYLNVDPANPLKELVGHS